MRVVITKPFSVDTANGRTRYEAGEEVASGQKNWIEKGLAREVAEPKPEPKPAAKPEPEKSTD